MRLHLRRSLSSSPLLHLVHWRASTRESMARKHFHLVDFLDSGAIARYMHGEGRLTSERMVLMAPMWVNSMSAGVRQSEKSVSRVCTKATTCTRGGGAQVCFHEGSCIHTQELCIMEIQGTIKGGVRWGVATAPPGSRQHISRVSCPPARRPSRHPSIERFNHSQTILILLRRSERSSEPVRSFRSAFYIPLSA
jgi:hypothetical protein